MATDNTGERRDPFAGIAPYVPTRYAPGDTHMPYQYDNPGAWYPVIYFSAGEVVDGEGPIWLVEPYPAARADGTDGLDPVDSAGVAVLRGSAAPRPRGASGPMNVTSWTVDERLDGDWIVPGTALAGHAAYDAHVTDQRQLMAAWYEAWAISHALNSGLVDKLGLHPSDIEVLLAAERGALVGDSRFVGTEKELRWLPVGTTSPCDTRRVPTRQVKSLRDRLRLIEPAVARDCESRLSGELSTDGASWVETTYTLTRAGRSALADIRRQGEAGPRRCRVCGCTDDRGCPGQCSWVPDDQGSLCSTCASKKPGFGSQLVAALTRSTPAFRP